MKEDEYSLKNEYNSDSGCIKIFIEIENEEENIIEQENSNFNNNHLFRRNLYDDNNQIDSFNEKSNETIYETINYPTFVPNKLTLEPHNEIITNSVLDNPKETTLYSLDITKKIFCHNKKLYEL